MSCLQKKLDSTKLGPNMAWPQLDLPNHPCEFLSLLRSRDASLRRIKCSSLYITSLRSLEEGAIVYLYWSQYLPYLLLKSKIL